MDKDPDWVAKPKKKKIQRRYNIQRVTSSSNGLPEPDTPGPNSLRSRLQPGELSIPTPYIVRNIRSDLNPLSANGGVSEVNTGVSNRHRGRPRREESDILDNKWVSKTEDEYVVLQNLTKSILELIDATNNCDEPLKYFPKHGARSLFAACCRKIPTLMDQVAAEQLDEPDEERIDAFSEIYNYIESDYAAPTLRAVVRAHGIHTVKKAIEEGLIPRDAVRSLVRHLAKPQRHQTTQPSPAEAEDLLSSLIAFETPGKHPKCCSDSHHFYGNSFANAGFLTPNVDLDSRAAFEFRQFRSLLLSPQIPLEWMATRRVVVLWSHVFRTFLDNQSATSVRDAYLLLKDAMELGVGMQLKPESAQKTLTEIPSEFARNYEACPRCPRAPAGSLLMQATGSWHQPGPSSDRVVAKNQLFNAFTNTLSSVSTILSSFAIAAVMNPDDLADINVQLISWVLNQLSMDIITYFHEKSRLSALLAGTVQSKLVARRAIPILVSTLVSQMAGCRNTAQGAVHANDLVRCLQDLDTCTRKDQNDQSNLMETLPALICSITRGTARILRKDDSFDVLPLVVRSLVHPQALQEAVSSPACYFLKQLAWSSAMMFADQEKQIMDRVQRSQHSALVREIERTMSQVERLDALKTSVRSAEKPRRGPGLLWEEGICEWVKATPVPAKIQLPIQLDLNKQQSSLPAVQPVPRAAFENASSPIVSLQLNDAEDQEGTNLSDLLLGVSSPLVPSSAIETGSRSRNSRLAQELSRHGSPEIELLQNNEQRNVGAQPQEVKDEEEDEDELGLESATRKRSRTTKSTTAKPHFNMQQTLRQPGLKRSLSEIGSLSMNNSDGEDELSSPKMPAKRRSLQVSVNLGRDTRAAGTSRNSRGTQLYSMPATTAGPPRTKRNSRRTARDESDDELSFN
jgi:hypothetical protein